MIPRLLFNDESGLMLGHRFIHEKKTFVDGRKLLGKWSSIEQIPGSSEIDL